MANSQCVSYKMALLNGILAYHNLCDEILVEILLRLPTKAAFRLKVVCKCWYSLISSPYFIARFNHLRHHRDVQLSSLVFQITNDCDRSSQNYSDFKTISNSSLLLSHLNYLPRKDIRLECSFDDLILCSYDKRIYYVSNLLTRQWIALPPPPACAGVANQIGFLCYDCKPVDTFYRKLMVVRLSIMAYRFNVQVFSSGDGQWRTLTVSSPLPLEWSTIVQTSLVAYRGMLHWLKDDCIVVYDPVNTPETFSRVIHHPIQPNTEWKLSSCFRLCVCQDHLRVVEHYSPDVGNPVVDVWKLEDYDSGLWNLVHKVDLNNLIYDNISLQIAKKSLQPRWSIVSVHPENEDAVYMLGENRMSLFINGIFLVNMKTRIVELYYPLKKNTDIGNAFPLAHKWWPTQVSSLNKSMEAMLA